MNNYTIKFSYLCDEGDTKGDISLKTKNIDEAVKLFLDDVAPALAKANQCKIEDIIIDEVI